MKEYIIKIMGIALLAAFSEMAVPKEWKKYMSVLTGVMLLTVIITPVASLGGVDVLSGYHEGSYSEQGAEIYRNLVREEFSKNLALEIKGRIHDEFLEDVSVTVEVSMNENNNIESIRKIIIQGKDLDNSIAERISYVYNVQEVVLECG